MAVDAESDRGACARTGRRVIKKRNRPDKVSTIKGVNFDKATSKWLVRVSENGKQRYFGRYATQELAETAASDFKKTQGDGTATTATASSTKKAKGSKPPPVKPPAKAEAEEAEEDKTKSEEAKKSPKD